MTEAALAAAGASFYASHNWQPFFIEGTKTLAFELWEQLGFAVPDNILVPTGYGSNILGLDRGFDEFERARRDHPDAAALRRAGGELRRLCRGWAAGGEGYVPFTPRPTVADGIATVKPVRVAEVLGALRRSRGGVVAVPEDEIAPALRALGRLGLFVEPTAATAGAALSQLLATARSGPARRRSSCSPGMASRRPTRSASCSTLSRSRRPAPHPGPLPAGGERGAAPAA